MYSPVTTSSTINLRWEEGDAFTDTSRKYVTYFVRHRKDGGTAWERSEPIPYQISQYQEYTITGLQPLSTYHLDVSVARAYHGVYYESEKSVFVTFGDIEATTTGKAQVVLKFFIC